MSDLEAGVRFPRSSIMLRLNSSKDPNLTADFGMDPYSKTERPRYRPLNPRSWTVCSVYKKYLFSKDDL